MTVDGDAERRLRALEERLRALEDLHEIQRLKARYAALTDARYGPDGPKDDAELARLAGEIAELFAEDAVWDAGGTLGVCRGRAEIRERFAKPTLLFSWHFFLKPDLVVEGERARGSWDVFAPCTLRDGRAFWMAGVEDDEYRREGGRWLHTRMCLRTVLFAPHAKGWGKK